MKNSENFTEARIQQEICVWYTNTYCLAHHSPRCMILSIPNEGNPRLTQKGAYPGASDLLVIHRTTERKWLCHDEVARVLPPRVIFIEIKTENGSISKKQRKFQKHVQQMGLPFEYHIIYNLEEFKKVILGY